MNYRDIHDSIINRAKNRIIKGYNEKHHILPRCMGGDNSSENIVRLTAKEHFVIHRLLVRIYPDNYKLAYALWLMCTKSRNTVGRVEVSASIYDHVKTMMSQATKDRLSKDNPWKGRRHSDNTKHKQSVAALNRVVSEETEKLRCESISKTLKGRPKSIRHGENISKSKMGNNNPMYGKKWRLENGKRVYYSE